MMANNGKQSTYNQKYYKKHKKVLAARRRECYKKNRESILAEARQAREARTVCYIYGLQDPRDSRIRYIGCTTCPINQRLSGHLSGRYTNIEKIEWLDELKGQQLRPTVVLLETVPKTSGKVEELNWISKLVTEGAELFNKIKGKPAKVFFQQPIKLNLSIDKNLYLDIGKVCAHEKTSPENVCIKAIEQYINGKYFLLKNKRK